MTLHFTGRAAALCTLVAATAIPAMAEDPAQGLVTQAQEAIRKTQTVQADLEIKVDRLSLHQAYTGTIALKRPNFARIELKGKSEQRLVVADGRDCITYAIDQKKYQKQPAGPAGQGISSLDVIEPAALFWNAAGLGRVPKDAAGPSLTSRGREVVGGIQHAVVQSVQPSPTPGMVVTVRYYLSLDNSLPYRVVRTVASGDLSTTSTSALKNVRVNKPIDVGLFQWTPPAGAETIP